MTTVCYGLHTLHKPVDDVAVPSSGENSTGHARKLAYVGVAARLIRTWRADGVVK